MRGRHDAGAALRAHPSFTTRKLYQEKGCSRHKLGGRGGRALGPALETRGAKDQAPVIMTNLKPPQTTWSWNRRTSRPGWRGFRTARCTTLKQLLSNRCSRADRCHTLGKWKRDVPEKLTSRLTRSRTVIHAPHPTPRTGQQVIESIAQPAMQRHPQLLGQEVQPVYSGPFAETFYFGTGASCETLQANILKQGLGHGHVRLGSTCRRLASKRYTAVIGATA